MSNLKIINSDTEIDMRYQWNYIDCKERTVLKKGVKYQIISKIERKYSAVEKINRLFLGFFLVICSFGFALISKTVKNLFLKNTKRESLAIPDTEDRIKGLNATYDQKITLSHRIKRELKNLIPSILEQKGEPEIIYHPSSPTHRVIEHKLAPGLVFKIGFESVQDLYQSNLEAQALCKELNLNLLVIPQVELYQLHVNNLNYQVLVQRKLDLEPQTKTEELLQNSASTLREAIRQLAVFICKTGYSNVDSKNNPVLKQYNHDSSPKKIALINIKKENNPEVGLFGGRRDQKGLVRCVNGDLGKVIAEAALENGVSVIKFANAWASSNRKLNCVDP